MTDLPGAPVDAGRDPVTGVEAAVERARAAQAMWADLPLPRRLEVLRELARTFSRHREEIVGAIRRETGKPRVEALAEIVAAVELLRHYARIAPRVLVTRQVDTGYLLGKTGHVVREPWGVVGVITPWNYPFLLTQDAVTAAVAGGNGVVVKPSEATPAATRIIPGLMDEAGFPPGLVQVVEGGAEVGSALVRSGVDKMVFTGSTATGRKVMAAAAEKLTPLVLELGGKDPAIVLEDAELERAARGVVFGAFFNAGQTCISTERVYVVDAIHDAFVERVVEVVGELRAGEGEGTDLAPLVTEDQHRIVREQLLDAREKGARFRTGGVPDDDPGRAIPPVVLTEVPDDARLLREETFGPLLPVVRVRDEEEALARANASGFGLFGSVWTRDLVRGERIAGRLQAGGVSINDTLQHYAVPGLPMGGVKDSGFGVRRGADGLREMTRPRTLFVHRRGMAREFFWFPYRTGSTRLVEALLVLRGEGWIRGIPGAVRVLRGRP